MMSTRSMTSKNVRLYPYITHGFLKDLTLAAGVGEELKDYRGSCVGHSTNGPAANKAKRSTFIKGLGQMSDNLRVLFVDCTSV